MQEMTFRLRSFLFYQWVDNDNWKRPIFLRLWRIMAKLRIGLEAED
jgi:hypothetical protein